MTGIFVVQSYIPSIFKEAGSNLSITESSIVTTVVQLVANLLAVLLIQKIGMKVSCFQNILTKD